MLKHTFTGVITTALNVQEFKSTFKDYMAEAEETEVGSLEVTATEEMPDEEDEEDEEEDESTDEEGPQT